MSCPAHEIAAVKGTLTSEQVDCLIEIARDLPDKKVLVYDLGSGVGTTALSVFMGRKKNIEIVSVDNRENEIYWAGIAMQNIGRSGDWKGVSGDVLDKSLVPAEGSIDLLIIDIDEVDYHDIMGVWKNALAPEGVIWSRYATGGIIKQEGESKVEVSTEGESNAEEQEQTEEGEKTETQEVEPSTEDGVRHTTQIGKDWSTEEDERPPCENCGYMPSPEKSYVHAMRAHKRTHKND